MNTKGLDYLGRFYTENQDSPAFIEEVITLFHENIALFYEMTETALENKNMEDCARSFHKLTNNFSALRMTGYGELSRRIESFCREGDRDEVIKNYTSLKNDLSLIVKESELLLDNSKVTACN